MTSGPDVIAAVDVGSPRQGSLGWCHCLGDVESTGSDLDGLADLVSTNLNDRVKVALGFEAPMFVPVPSTHRDLSHRRLGEGNRSWCAPIGAAVLGLATQQTAYVLGRIAPALTRPIAVGLDPAGLHDPSIDLVLWEAFVSGGSKDRAAEDRHISDARAAVRELANRLGTDPEVQSDVTSEGAVFSIIGAAVLRSGLSTDLGLLAAECLVIRAPDLALVAQLQETTTTG